MVFRTDATQHLRSEDSKHFRTRQVLLNNQGRISPHGPVLDFSAMQALRQRGVIGTVAEGQVFANMGVSLQLIVQHQGRKALVLVPQNGTLKLVSGYVPDDHLADPLQTAWAEVMEEVLPVTETGALYGFAYTLKQQTVPLVDPYQLPRKGCLTLSPTPLLLQGQAVTHSFAGADGVSSLWPMTSYRDETVACLQLVFSMVVDLPDSITLFHVDDVFDRASGQLLSTFDPASQCVLMVLDAQDQLTDDFFTLTNGHWQPFDASAFRLSEAFSLLPLRRSPR